MASIDFSDSYLKDNIIFEKKGKKGKMDTNDFSIPTTKNYKVIKQEKYSIFHLKHICGFYKIKKSGNKNELINRIYDYLRYSLFTVKIQKLLRGYMLRKYINLAGPALRNRSICINDTDFATLEPIIEIPYNQFFSFSDSNSNIYGCDITSLYGLLNKKTVYDMCSNRRPLNPYNRTYLEDNLISNFSLYLRLAKVNNIDHVIVEEEMVMDPVKQLEMKIFELFQYINELGNYADSKWFTNLSRHMIVLFIREMYDIWHYRAQLTEQMMEEIVPPNGNPFVGMNLHSAQTQDNEHLKTQAVRIIDRFVKSGRTSENRSLGAYYVLAALTLVSEDARNALPWLYQSVAH